MRILKSNRKRTGGMLVAVTVSPKLDPQEMKAPCVDKVHSQLPGQGEVLPHLKANGRGALGKSILRGEPSFCHKKAKAMLTVVAEWIANFTYDRRHRKIQVGGRWEQKGRA